MKELGDGTDAVTGTPVLENIEVLDASDACDAATVVNPVCMAPKTAAPTPAQDTTAEPALHASDCTKEFCENELSPDYLLRYQINVPSDTNVDVYDGCTISMELICDGEAWVGIAFSTDGQMLGSEAVM